MSDVLDIVAELERDLAKLSGSDTDNGGEPVSADVEGNSLKLGSLLKFDKDYYIVAATGVSEDAFVVDYDFRNNKKSAKLRKFLDELYGS
jgi:hypothetical protein